MDQTCFAMKMDFAIDALMVSVSDADCGSDKICLENACVDAG